MFGVCQSSERSHSAVLDQEADRIGDDDGRRRPRMKTAGCLVDHVGGLSGVDEVRHGSERAFHGNLPFSLSVNTLVGFAYASLRIYALYASRLDMQEKLSTGYFEVFYKKEKGPATERGRWWSQVPTAARACRGC